MNRHFPKFFELNSWFWHSLTIFALSIGLLDSWQRQPEVLLSWHGLIRVGLCLAFFCVYFYFGRSIIGRSWQIKYTLGLAYTAIQLLILLILLNDSQAFVIPIFILSSQITAALPWRYWTIPLGAVFVVLSVALGLGEAIQTRNWAGVGGIMIALGFTAGIQILIVTLYLERYKREELISQLHTAKTELEHYALQVEEMAILHERTRLARDMHDNLGHALVVVNIKLEAAERLYAVDAERGARELQATRELVRTAMQSLRHSLTDLRSSSMINTHINDALQHSIAEFQQRSQLPVNIQMQTIPTIPQAIAEVAWYCTREALHNIERHAYAQQVDFNLTKIHDTVQLLIQDDGRGFELAKARLKGHYGLLGMRERVEGVGGSLQIKPHAPHGTTVIVRLPLAN